MHFRSVSNLLPVMLPIDDHRIPLDKLHPIQRKKQMIEKTKRKNEFKEIISRTDKRRWDKHTNTNTKLLMHFLSLFMFFFFIYSSMELAWKLILFSFFFKQTLIHTILTAQTLTQFFFFSLFFYIPPGKARFFISLFHGSRMRNSGMFNISVAGKK